ncbi:MAG TPA: hypothetical protein DCQ37_24785, partial [Desulfobacteraceae bacterium]|nr:hypothetical protein [Desulfobacteraceae bacterium]
PNYQNIYIWSKPEYHRKKFSGSAIFYEASYIYSGVTHLDFKMLILLIAICAMHNADIIKIDRLIFQLRKS